MNSYKYDSLKSIRITESVDERANDDDDGDDV